jgi:hypothetical protein
VVSGPWKRLVFGHPAHEEGSVNRHAYAFCVMEQFWRGLKRREIYAGASTKWRNPQAELLEGAQWEAIRPDALTALGLPGNPDALLASTPAPWTPPSGNSAGAWPPTPTSGWTRRGRST